MEASFSTVAAACGVLVLIALLRAVIRFLRSPLMRFPMPPTASPILGHLKELSDPRHHRILSKWEGQIGQLYVVRVFWERIVVCSDPVLVHQLLHNIKSLGVDKSTGTYQQAVPLSSDKGHPSLFSASTHSPYWRLVRKGVAPGFSSRCLRQGPEVLQRLVGAEFRHIQHTAAQLLTQLRDIGPDTVFDVDRLAMCATLDVIGRVAFDIDFKAVQEFRAASDSVGAGAQEDDILAVIRMSLDELNLRWANPLRARFLFWTPMCSVLQEVRRAQRYWGALQQHMKGILKQIRSQGPLKGDAGTGMPALEGDESIAAHLLRLKDPHTGKPLSDDRILPEIATFFIAGMDTTAHTIAWTLYLLAQHPEAEEQLCRELDELGLLATPQCPKPRMVVQSDLNKLVYLSAVVKESMRVLPVSADGTAVQVPQDIQLGGHIVPANTPIWIHTYSTHNSSRHWEQPECFRPERFLQPGAEYAASTPNSAIAAGQAGGAQAKTAAGNASSSSGRALTSTQPLKFYPFSQGQRDCIGQSLARMDYLALLAVLLGSYRFILAGQAAAPGGVRDIISLTLQPEHGLPVLAVPRIPS
ncbi:Cytochrome P450 4V2 [Chlorella vulgaris]